MFYLIAQEINHDHIDYWLTKWDKYGWSGCISIGVMTLIFLFVYLCWKYVPRFIDNQLKIGAAQVDLIDHLKEAQKAGVANDTALVESQQKLLAVNAKQVEVLSKVEKASQDRGDPIGEKFKDHHFSSSRLEACVGPLCNALEVAVAKIAPEMIPEIRQHTNEMRAMVQRKDVTERSK